MGIEHVTGDRVTQEPATLFRIRKKKRKSAETSVKVSFANCVYAVLIGCHQFGFLEVILTMLLNKMCIRLPEVINVTAQLM